MGCILESAHYPDQPPVAVGDPKNCNFLNEDFMHALCGIEWDMHKLVREVIEPEDVVLEFGGRYGTTTCAIDSVQNNSGALSSNQQ